MRKHFLLFALGLMLTFGVQQIQADGSFPENTIWSEDFESGVLPEGWIATSANWSIDGGDHRDGTTAFSGIKNLLYYYFGRDGGVDTLYTATIDLSGYTNVSLNFTFMNAKWDDDIDFLEVFYRNSPDESWTSLGGLIEDEHSDWTGFNSSLANVSSTFQLAFAAHSNSGHGVAIDDIYITGTALTPDPAGDKLTVFEGEITNSNVPFYGIFGEAYLRSQYLIPAEALTELVGKKINALRWYSSRTDIPNYGDARIDVYLKEVDSVALRNFVEKEEGDIVYHGKLLITLAEDGKCILTIGLDKEFVYLGGNLLVGCDNVENGEWTSIQWYGQNVNNASVSGASYSALSEITATQRNFIPQTTFFYEDAPEEEAIKGLQAEVEGSTVEISWNGEGDSFDLRYKPFSGKTGFEDGVLAPWTTIDADGDGYNWFMGNSGIEYAHTGGEYAQSESYANYISASLTPDNYLVSPKVQLGGSITFWAAAQSGNYYIEHFGVAVSTTSNTDPETFTTIQEWSTTDSRTYYQYTVDLSEYAGQSGYVAIRHFNCTDQFRLNIDDIEIEQPGVTIPESTDWTEVESIFSSPYTIENLEPGSYVLQVRAVEAEVPSNWSESVTFFIEASTGIEEIVDGRSSLVDGQKILHEGHLYLLRDGKIFNAQGARVK